MQGTDILKGQTTALSQQSVLLSLAGVVIFLVGVCSRELISMGVPNNLKIQMQTYGGSKSSMYFVEKPGTMKTCESQDRNGPDKDSRYLKFMLASLPRSGNTFSRLLLENMTGIHTEVSKNSGNRLQDSRTGKYYPASKDCARDKMSGEAQECRPSSGDDLVIIKTHFPDIPPDINESEGCISGVILIVRHPVDQFLARAAVAGTPNTLSRVKEMNFFVAKSKYKFPTFLNDWEKFQNFWHSYASVHNVPLLAYRYEDLCQDPEGVMRRVAAFIGVEFKNVRSSNGVFDSCFLRNPHIMSKSAGLLTQAELDLLKTRPLPIMDRFGYRRDISLSTDFETGL
ncbi:hypothetical protein M9435_002146 [Picochlorum sp. BPE23]|nr:hypothetical protein M9435_002146 [Picochlorum sp. BPE23]